MDIKMQHSYSYCFAMSRPPCPATSTRISSRRSIPRHTSTAIPTTIIIPGRPRRPNALAQTTTTTAASPATTSPSVPIIPRRWAASPVPPAPLPRCAFSCATITGGNAAEAAGEPRPLRTPIKARAAAVPPKRNAGGAKAFWAGAEGAAPAVERRVAVAAPPAATLTPTTRSTWA